MVRKVWIVGALAVALCALSVASVVAEEIPLDPGKEFRVFTRNSNDGYSGFRGMVFTANESFDIDGLGLYTKKASGELNATFEVWKIRVTRGNVLAGATKVGQGKGSLSGELEYHNVDLDSPVGIEQDASYLVRVGYAEAADENWFYLFDPARFGHEPVDIGVVTLIDGTSGGNTANSVATPMQIITSGGGCGENAKLKARCKKGGEKAIGGLKKATPNTKVIFWLDWDQERTGQTNNNGKAKVKWKKQKPGKHTVSVCGLQKGC